MVPAWLDMRQVQTFHRNDPLQQHRAHTMWAGSFSNVQIHGAAPTTQALAQLIQQFPTVLLLDSNSFTGCCPNGLHGALS